MKRLTFTVTNDLTYDQRMIRICTSLAKAGYQVTLIGTRFRHSDSFAKQPFRQRRISCLFSKGKAFYLEYNLKLFIWLLFHKTGTLCAIDLDTIFPCYLISVLKGSPRVYDAHELFCEMKEVVTRPAIYKAWKRLERYTVPKFKYGYTVNVPIAGEFKNLYDVQYEVIRNLPVLAPLTIPNKNERFILYQGAVNEGRAFEMLIPAMQHVEAQLVICGDGNFMQQAQELTMKYGLSDKVIFKGKIPPAELKDVTLKAWAGVTLFENKGLSNYLSLANRFFDYMHAGIPQVCSDYPAYREINNLHGIAVLIDMTPENIAVGLNRLLRDNELYSSLQQNCLSARQVLNWQEEEKKLLAFFSNIQ
jgi:glycosyltransferase involved in cell wall biosynthesis